MTESTEFAPPAETPKRRRRLAVLPGSHGADLTREAPFREIAMGMGVLIAFLLIFGVWAALARLDAGVYANGQIVVAGNRQSVQHRDGGIVQELSVKEGAKVTAGQVLLRLAAGELRANERSVATQIIEQKALQARLMAELAGGAIAFPAEFSSMTGEDRIAAQRAITLQRLEYARRAEALASERRVLANQAAQSSEQAVGYDKQITSSQRQQALVKEEMTGLRDLRARGLVPETRMRSLERSSAQIQGEEGAYTASRARTQQEMGEKRIRMETLKAERDAEDAKEYRSAQMQLGELEPKLVALREQIGRTVVRSPATGQVVGLSVFTLGGVVAPGAKLMDVVPQDEPLVIEAKVKPSDADGLRIGQNTEIKISAFHDRELPKLNGVISKISADSFTDEKSGATYFRIEATVPPSELEKIRRVRGPDAGLKPGLSAEIVVPLKARSALDYMISPLKQSLWRSFREH